MGQKCFGPRPNYPILTSGAKPGNPLEKKKGVEKEDKTFFKKKVALAVNYKYIITVHEAERWRKTS